MSARKLPITWVQSVAEHDATYLLNARLAVKSRERGIITPIQLDTLLRWQQMSAVRRLEKRSEGGAR